MFFDRNVYVTGHKGAFLNVKEAFGSLDLSDIKGKSVLIKPNIGRCVEPEKGINTHPLAIAGVIEVLHDYGIKNIAIGESPILGVNTLEAFRKSKVDEIARKYNCKLIDMDDKSPKEIEIPNGKILKSTKICSYVFEYDVLISLPVAKCHMHTGVSLSIKNLKGCLYKREKVRYHQLENKDKNNKEKTLDLAIADLATVLFPDIAVIDGYIGMEGLGPSGGDAIKSDFAVASFNALGADIVTTLLMGKDPVEISHLRLIAQNFNSSLSITDYKVFPVDFIKYRVNYKSPPDNIAIEYPDVLLCDKESCSACLSTVMFFLKRFKEDISKYKSKDGMLNFAIGKGVTLHDIKENTVLIGNCTSGLKNYGIYIPGCPPVPTRIYKAITGIEPEKNEPELEK